MAPATMKAIESVVIRKEQPADIDAIRDVTELAFRGAAHTCGREHLLVGDLRDAGALSLSLVAIAESGIVGHAALSPVAIPNATGRWYGLGPISVLPACQRRGVGSALMHAALAWLTGQGAAGCVLVGDPAYYVRFGFAADPLLQVDGVPPEVTLSIRLRPNADRGTAQFHPAFAG